MTELRIDPEFRDKIPPLTEAEFDQLKENILNDGEVYEPICVWNGTIVDGHNRWKIVQEHPEIPYRTKDMNFTDKWEAFEWMYRKQLGRRNLTDEQRTYMIGKMYEARKKSQGGTGANQYTRTKEQIGQNVHSATRRESRDGTAGQIGKDFGIDGKTVRRAEKFADGIDVLSEVSHDAANKILKGGSGVRKGKVMELPQMETEKIEDFAKEVLSVDVKEQPQKSKHPGWTKSDRERRKTLDSIVDDMYDATHTNMTVESLIECINMDGQNYVDMLRNILTDHSVLLTGNNRTNVAECIDVIIGKIRMVRELVA